MTTAPDPLPKTESLSAHILLAEDNPVNQEVALSMLEVLGCKVTVAANGLEALEEASRTGFDLILMDCQMPGMDGYQATRVIRESERTEGEERIPIVALTAHAMEGDRERCLAAGMDDYLAKPFTQKRLAQVLKRWLEKNPTRRETIVEAVTGRAEGSPDSKVGQETVSSEFRVCSFKRQEEIKENVQPTDESPER